MTEAFNISNKILFTKYLLVFLISGLLTTMSFSQASLIKLIDSKSNEPVPYATVLIIDLSTKTEYFKVSDEAGQVVNPGKNLSVIKISCIGYNAHSDTISAGKSYEFALLPTIFSLDEVVVTGSIKPQRADKSIYNIKVIDRRIIEGKPQIILKIFFQAR